MRPSIRHDLILATAMIVTMAVLPTLVATPAHAVTIDGSLDGEYGVARSTQTTQTDFGDTPGPPVYGEGSELDEAFGFVADGVLYLYFSGNLVPFTTEPLTNPDELEIFIDCIPGGQNQLRSDNPAVGPELKLNELAGLRFDSEFSPDFWFDFSPMRGSRVMAFYSSLPSESGGTGYYMGRSGPLDAGVLSGGTNPYGVRAAIDPSNVAGVTAGCGPASGAGATAGFEWSIPLAAIGNPTGTIKVSAFIATDFAPQVSNQALGSLPPGTCSLGAASGVDFSAIPGEQHFIIDVSVPVRQESMGFVKRLYAR